MYSHGAPRSFLKSMDCFVRLLLSTVNTLILCILGYDETTHHGKCTRLFLLVETFDPGKEEMQLKKQHYLFLIKYYVSARCVWNHMIPLFLALWPHVWSHAFLWFSVLHNTLKPAWMGSHHKETVALYVSQFINWLDLEMVENALTMHLQCTLQSMLIRPDHGLLVTLEFLKSNIHLCHIYFP